MNLHTILALASGVAVAVVGLDGVARAWYGRVPGTLTARAAALALILLGAAAAGGLGSLIRDPGARQWLYVMYGVLAFGSMAIIGALARPTYPRLSGLTALLGALWTLALITRLFATG
jgi:H+/gluconate symporter-like permease